MTSGCKIFNNSQLKTIVKKTIKSSETRLNNNIYVNLVNSKRIK